MPIWVDGRQMATGVTLGMWSKFWLSDDMDWFAAYWDEDEQRIKSVMYDTERFGGSGRAVVDASEDVRAKALEWLLASIEGTVKDLVEVHMRRVEKGCRVRSRTTRGKNKGVSGVVKWMGVNRFDPHGKEMRVGFLVDGEEKLRYLPEYQVERVDVPESDEELVCRLVVERVRNYPPEHWGRSDDGRMWHWLVSDEVEKFRGLESLDWSDRECG